MLTVCIVLCGAALYLGAVSESVYWYVLVLVAAALLALWFVLPPVVRRMAKMGALRAWILLTIVCIVVKTAWVLLVRVPVDGDYAVFWSYAQALARPEFTAGSRYMALFPHIFGYSKFLSVFIRLFGEGKLLAQILNVCLSVCSGSLLFLLCRRWNSLHGAISVYLFWIVCPSQTIYNSLVLSEPLYTTLILVFLLLVTELERRESHMTRPVAIGVMIGAVGGLLLRWINGVRPIAAVLVIALLIWLLLLKKIGRWQFWLPFASVLLVIYAVTGPLWNAWIAREIGEEPAETVGYSITVGFNQASGGRWNQEDSDLLFAYSNQPGATAQWTQEQMLAEAKERIFSGEINFADLFRQKLQTFLGTDEVCVNYSAAALEHRVRFETVCNVFYLVTLLLSIGGGICLWRKRERGAVLFVPLFAIGLTLAQMLVEVAQRYHYSMIPMLLILGQFVWMSPTLKRRIER